MQAQSPDQPSIGANAADDLKREVYGILGIPIDVADMPAVVRRIEAAAARGAPFLISTANLNFLIASQTDVEFRESLLRSDLCTADGMPIVWIGRMLGIPVGVRIAGSDIFEALKSNNTAQPLKVFLFGGAEGAAAAACSKLNATPGGLSCSGSYEPGFGGVEEMSTDAILASINASSADFLAVALGAKKGQAWLLRNHECLRVPVRVHLGATINFQAGTVQRAPLRVRQFGLEWLWRIKEEPQLWKRYWNDGLALLKLLVMRVLPLVVLDRWDRLKHRQKGHGLKVARSEDHNTVIFTMNGDATRQNIGEAVASFAEAAVSTKNFDINLAEMRVIDARFLGLLLMLNKALRGRHLELRFTGVSQRTARLFRLNGFGFLLQN